MTTTNLKSKIPIVKLNNGLEMPALGFGTSGTALKTGELEEALKYALKLGYRQIDSAWVYYNHSVIGRAIKQAIDESNGNIKREDFFLTSKVWNTHHSKRGVRQTMTETLKDFDVQYLDLVLIHWPMGLQENVAHEPQESFPRDCDGILLFSDIHYLETWAALEEHVGQGKLKSIGLSNFNIAQCADVINNARIKPVCNQIEMHPYFQNERLVEFCQNNGMVVQAYAPLHAAELSELRLQGPRMLEDTTLIDIGLKYGKTPAQVCLRWSVQRGCVPIVKALDQQQILQNTEIFDFELTSEDMEAIRKLDKNERVYTAPQEKQHPLYPFSCNYAELQEDKIERICN